MDEIVLVNVLRPKPGQADALIDALRHIYDTLMGHQPGFISVRVHKSLDGSRVAAVARWASLELFEEARKQPGFEDLRAAVRSHAEGNDVNDYRLAFEKLGPGA